MAERLGEIPQELPRVRVDLFRQQPQRIGAAAEGLVELMGLVHASLPGQVVHQPEAAEQERAARACAVAIMTAQSFM